MEKLMTIQDSAGNKIVLLPDAIFTNKQNIDWNDVEKYLKQYVGEIIEIIESKDTVYLGKDFPDEYTGCLVVNCTLSGKMYLYDLVDIKKEASNPLKTTR